MSYIWFNLVLEALGKRLNYESISNLYGNSFAKDSAKLVQRANPLIKGNANAGNGIMALVSKIKIIDAKKNANAVNEILGDISWAT